MSAGNNPEVIDSSAWTGKSGRLDAETAKILIVVIYAFAGPLVGAFLYIAGDGLVGLTPFNPFAIAFVVIMSSFVLIPYFTGLFPAVLSGIAVAALGHSRIKSFVAAAAAPLVFYGVLAFTGKFTGALASMPDGSKLALPLAALGASLTCWLLTLPLQRRT